MPQAARFMFDIDFSATPGPRKEVPEAPQIGLAEHEAAVAAAEARGAQRGFAEGQADAKAEAAREIARNLDRVAENIAAALADLEGERQRLREQAIELAVTVARKLAAALVAREPLGEIRALVGECLGPLRSTPHLVVRTHADDVEALGEITDRLVHEHGFEGKLVLLGEPDLARGDCRIEWADGGIIRDRCEIEREIDALIGRYLAARTGSGSAGPQGVDGRNGAAAPARSRAGSAIDGDESDPGSTGPGEKADE